LPLHDKVAQAIAAGDAAKAEAAIRRLIACARHDVETDMARDDFLRIDGVHDAAA